MSELSEYVPVNLISSAVLGTLLLRRLVRMDEYHTLRVVILTGLLWVPVAYLFLISFIPAHPGCVPQPDESDAYSRVLR